MRLFAVPRRAFFTCLVFGVMSLVALQGCSDDDDDDDNPMNPPGGQSTQFSGAFAGSGDGGKMTITIPLASTALAPRFNGAAAVVNATGTLSPTTGGTINLTGTYDESSNTIALTDGSYTFGGTYDPAAAIPGFTGNYNGPNGAGGFAAGVGTGAVTTYCGSWVNLAEESGNLNLIIVGANLSGVVVVDGAPYNFQGTITGTAPNQTINVNDEIESGIVLTAQGSLDSNTGQITDGTWQVEVDSYPTDEGTWQGSTSCSNTLAN